MTRFQTLTERRRVEILFICLIRINRSSSLFQKFHSHQITSSSEASEYIQSISSIKQTKMLMCNYFVETCHVLCHSHEMYYVCILLAHKAYIFK